MTEIKYIQADGSAVSVSGNYSSMMHAAVASGVYGIVGECGGNAMCATCHVFVAEKDLSRLPNMEEGEDEMLEGVATERTDRSRLSCQLPFDESLTGLTLEIPRSQV